MSQPQQLTIQQAISRAKKAVKQGNPVVAVEIYTAILEQEPKHPIAKKGLRKLQKELRQNPSLEAETSNPPQEQITALINLYSSGQLTKTEQASRDLLQNYPQSLVVTNLLGVVLRGQGKLKESGQAFDKAIQLKPDSAEAHYNLGTVLKQLGRLSDAVKSFEGAIQLRPDLAEAHYNLGNALRALGQLRKAVASYDKAIQLKPDFTEAYSNRGNALKDLGRLDEALASCAKAIQLKPDQYEAYGILGDVYLWQGLNKKGLRMKRFGEHVISFDASNGINILGRNENESN